MAQVLTERCDGAAWRGSVSFEEPSSAEVFEDGQLAAQVRAAAADGSGGLVDAGLVSEYDEALAAEPGACSAERVA